MHAALMGFKDLFKFAQSEFVSAVLTKSCHQEAAINLLQIFRMTDPAWSIMVVLTAAFCNHLSNASWQGRRRLSSLSILQSVYFLVPAGKVLRVCPACPYCTLYPSWCQLARWQEPDSLSSVYPSFFHTFSIVSHCIIGLHIFSKTYSFDYKTDCYGYGFAHSVEPFGCSLEHSSRQNVTLLSTAGALRQVPSATWTLSAARSNVWR